MALSVPLLSCLSVLLHELAHSLGAKARGMPVRNITLFLFGGVSNLEREPPSPGAQLLMAAAGPWSSLAPVLGNGSLTRLLRWRDLSQWLPPHAKLGFK